MERRIKKPNGYVKHRIVYDTEPILIIDLDYTLFQAQQVLGDSSQEFEVVEDGDELVIKEL